MADFRRESGLVSSYNGRIQPRRVVTTRPRRKRYRGEAADLGAETGDLKEMTDAELQIKSLLVGVGEGDEEAVVKKLGQLSTELEADLESHGPFVTGLILECVKNLPARAPVYACLVRLMGRRRTSFPGSLVAALQLEMEEELKGARVHSTHMRLMVRFCASLVNCRVIQSDDLVRLLRDLVAIAGRCAPVVRDRTVYTVLNTLLWLDPGSVPKEDIAAVLKACKGAVGERKVLFVLRKMEPKVVDHEGKGSSGGEDLLSRMLRLAAAAVEKTEGKDGDGWQGPGLVPRPHKHTELAGEFKDDEGGAKRCELSVRTADTKILSCADEVTPVQFPLRMLPKKFDKGCSELDRAMASEVVDDTIELFHESHEVCARQLLGLKLGVPFKHLLIEGVVNSVFTLPRPRQSLLWYSSLILELFKKDSKTLAPLFALAVQGLFKRAERLDVELMDRLTEWFTIHISHLDYKYAWEHWECVAELPEWDEQRVFVTETLKRVMRLKRKSLQDLPEKLLDIEPPRPRTWFMYQKPQSHLDSIAWKDTKKTKGSEAEQERDSKDDDEKDMEDEKQDASDDEDDNEPKYDKKFRTLTLDLIDMLEDPGPTFDATVWLDSHLEKKDGDNEANSIDTKSGEDEFLRLKLFFPCLLEAGRRSVTHLVREITRYKSELKKLINSKEKALLAMGICAEFHKKDDSRLVTATEKLMHHAIIQPMQVVEWALMSAEAPMRFTRFEVLKKAILKTQQKRMLAQKKSLGVDDMGKQQGGLVAQLKKQERALFAIAFRRFGELASEMEAGDSSGDKDKLVHTRRHLLGRMKEVGRWFLRDMRPYLQLIYDKIIMKTPSTVKTTFESIMEYAAASKVPSGDEDDLA